ncbi:uncharacterized protein ASPGLDRAFT_70162 [Aspergillus glaucus CBS 516.65]|uniref:Protein kinase domain-containing protein n=1 Tax=Aspergillus glaucus CBS 516.65 TaxID=1160497 RepID=A0A1L9V6C4_ASPGL|nr:hypothetical protein ASPGLDRAFT_70162 [Aspergillus glaucus CBS 516.65]OJJ79456.1 hypothetical protein ASPGLDRAFT_70162 [Aspergillus glaucus CBS 516.65]
MKDDFLSLVRKDISMGARKQVLKNVLLDIKPDNIIVDCHRNGQQTTVEQARIIDLDNVSYLPKPWCLKGMAVGNENWRSPEAHFRARLNKPTDTFSFSAVCIYAMLGRVIFGPDGDMQHIQSLGISPFLIRLQRQILCTLWEDRLVENILYRSFYEWPDAVGLNPFFKDLVRQLISPDPKRRVTAREALEHPWFADV